MWVTLGNGGMFQHPMGDEMLVLKHSNEREHSTQKSLQFILARGKSRFLVRGSLVGTVILWMAISGPFIIRGHFHGLGVAYVALMETGALLIIFPFALAIAYFQWGKLQKIASGGSSFGDQDVTRGQKDGETK